MCFDVTNRASFESVPAWLDDLRRFAQPEMHVILLGLKAGEAEMEAHRKRPASKPRVVSAEEARAYVASLSSDPTAGVRPTEYVECSSLTTCGVEQAVCAMMTELKQAGKLKSTAYRPSLPMDPNPAPPGGMLGQLGLKCSIQ